MHPMATEGLFPIEHDKPVQPAPQAGRIVRIAVNTNLWRPFDYLWPEELGIPQIGQRVRVPFGRGDRTTMGFVVEDVSRPDTVSATAEAGGGTDMREQDARVTRGRHAHDTRMPPAAHRLKHVAQLVDEQSQFDEGLWKLAGWISQYYLTPLGMVLSAMIPSAVGRHPPREETVVYLLAEHRRGWPDRLGLRQKNMLDELYEARKQGIEPLPLEMMLRHSGGSRQTIKALLTRNMIRLDKRAVVLPELAEGSIQNPFPLSIQQQEVLVGVQARLGGGFSATLLHGVTGSGKTEVYVRAIQQVIQAGMQAILLAPEIALATQTVQRLVQRLPRVAVLHSGLTDAQRAFYYQQIRDGHAAVVIGPRSAIFAPTRKLGLIVVDEEHEPSYKQDTTPRYHGRDVAIKRAQISGVPVILGSATPSLESYHNALSGKYEMLRLTHRVKDLPMPALEVVNLRQEMQPGRIEMLGATLTHRMASVLDRKGQIILLLNRRGYASYVFCPSCQWTMACDDCARTMVFHQATQLALCHYCQHTKPLPECCPACRKKLLLFGFGIQRIESELHQKFPLARFARMDSDTMTSPAQFQKVLDGFGRGELDILLGTQMVAKGLDFPNVQLVGVVSADTSLAIPDFRASERTFQLIVQVAGRAGRAEHSGQVIVQTLHAEEPAIQLATRHDYEAFARGELDLRQEIVYPPFARLIRFVVRHENQDKARQGAELLADALRKIVGGGQVRIVGPQPCGAIKLRKQFRFEILILTLRPGHVQQLLAPRMEQICRDIPAEIVADVDPVQLL